MILLDTDHATFLKYPDSERGRRMIDRLDAVTTSEIVGVTSFPRSPYPCRLRHSASIRGTQSVREGIPTGTAGNEFLGAQAVREPP